MSLHAVVLVAVDLAVLFLPGLALALVAGLRWSVAVPVAPLLTYGVTTAMATVASSVRLHWGPWMLLLATVVSAGIIAGLRLATGRGSWRERLRIHPPRGPRWRDWVVAGGVLAGGALSAGVLYAGFGSFSAPNQDYDYIFHANAVRLISDSGDLAPAAMRQINDWESSTFYYPNTFHGVAAIVRDLTGAGVFEVLNSQAMIVCLVAGLGLACLLRRLGAPLAVVATTPVLLAGFASYPYDVLWRGPLLPYAAGLALIPAFVLLLDRVLTRRAPATAVLFGLAAAGLLGVHPGAALAAVIFGAVFVVWRWVRSIGVAPRDLLVLAGAGVVALVVALPAVRGAVTTGAEGPQVNWPAIESPGQAAGDLLFLNHAAAHPQYWLAGLIVVGLLAVHRMRYLWSWLTAAGLMAVLFVMAASSDGNLTETLTRPWWNDRWRFAALAVLGLAPLAAHGLWTLAGLARDVVRRVGGARARRLPVGAVTGVLAVLGLLVVVLGSKGLYAASNEQRMAGTYQSQRTLSSTEDAAMLWLERHSSGGTIMNDSNDGSAYLSAVAGLHPLFGHVVEPGSISSRGPTEQLLLEHFNCLDSDPDVRRAIERLHIHYVWLGSGFVRDDMHRVAGLEGIASSPSLKLVHSAPGVQVYAVDLGPQPTAPLPSCTLRGAPSGQGG